MRNEGQNETCYKQGKTIYKRVNKLSSHFQSDELCLDI